MNRYSGLIDLFKKLGGIELVYSGLCEGDSIEDLAMSLADPEKDRLPMRGEKC